MEAAAPSTTAPFPTTTHSYFDSDPILPTTSTSLPTEHQPQETTLSRLDRDSAIALGAVLCLILTAILWTLRTRTKHRREHLRDLELRDSPNNARMGIQQTRTSRVDRKGSWPRGREERGAGDGRESVATLPRYSASWARRDSAMRGTWGSMGRGTDREMEKRWWGSVAKYGSTARADRDHPLPALPPSPTLSSITRSPSTRSTPCRYSVHGYEWPDPEPQAHYRCERHGPGERLGRFRGVV
ncbi:hypothetical protein BU26DRAFT_82879 [Trematosphaeria pertusa]|uniref:Uncharacterized protein n=1 Tax=Trematosphaeria pertusa TaxID=390896 RepID=A0A6A6I4W5_9PLEO|nr:uncharacterized protein BU26DRAFT_82879 [Trematosphaeria pertusa]KAF2244630.1 hypothetical protein BU26DRAFT_82879 [Trematosphaeria pertusa]